MRAWRGASKRSLRTATGLSGADGLKPAAERGKRLSVSEPRKARPGARLEPWRKPRGGARPNTLESSEQIRYKYTKGMNIYAE